MNKKSRPFILIADDNQQVLKSLEIWLRNEGFEPVTALDGEEALRAVKDKNITVALVDLRLKREDGINVARKLKEVDKNLKIIILTGFPSYETAVGAMKIGAFDYISKGSSNERIMKSIKKAIAGNCTEDFLLGKRDFQEKERIRLILFCDHSLIQERLENISNSNPCFQLLKTFPQVDYLKIKDFLQEIDIALVCASCNMKNIKDAYLLFAELYRCFPTIKPVIINENFSDKEKVELLKLGARGFASCDLSSERLERGLLIVKKGGFLVSQSVINLSLQTIINHNPTSQFEDKEAMGLTSREIDILKTMTLGLKNREIAERLFISEKTVKTHINRIFKKLGVNNRAKAILAVVGKKIL